jgi:hypothetical protein
VCFTSNDGNTQAQSSYIRRIYTFNYKRPDSRPGMHDAFEKKKKEIFLFIYSGHEIIRMKTPHFHYRPLDLLTFQPHPFCFV